MKKVGYLALSCAVAITAFSGCGSDDGDVNRYETLKLLNDGQYDQALNKLTNCKGFSEDECNMNRGAAYYGRGGFDLLDMGRKLLVTDTNSSASEEWKEQKMTEILMDPIVNGGDDIEMGARYFKRLLPKKALADERCSNTDLTNYKSLSLAQQAACHDVALWCNEKNKVGTTTSYYDDLNHDQQQACIALNPILLKEKLSDEETQSTVSVDIETMVGFKDVADAAMPGLTTNEMVNIMNGGAVENSRDVNRNDTPDALEVTECTIRAYNMNAGVFVPNVCTEFDRSFSFIGAPSTPFTTTAYQNYEVVRSSISRFGTSQSFMRLVSRVNASSVTTVTIMDQNMSADGTAKMCNYLTDNNCYPMPKTNEEGDVETFNDAVLQTVNDDALIESIALLSDDNENKSSDQKVIEFKESICGDVLDSSGNLLPILPVSSTCAEEDGKLIITQEALLNYMANDKAN